MVPLSEAFLPLLLVVLLVFELVPTVRRRLPQREVTAPVVEPAETVSVVAEVEEEPTTSRVQRRMRRDGFFRR